MRIFGCVFHFWKFQQVTYTYIYLIQIFHSPTAEEIFLFMRIPVGSILSLFLKIQFLHNSPDPKKSRNQGSGVSVIYHLEV